MACFHQRNLFYLPDMELGRAENEAIRRWLPQAWDWADALGHDLMTSLCS